MAFSPRTSLYGIQFNNNINPPPPPPINFHANTFNPTGDFDTFTLKPTTPGKEVINLLYSQYDDTYYLSDLFQLWVGDRNACEILANIESCAPRYRENIRQFLRQGLGPLAVVSVSTQSTIQTVGNPVITQSTPQTVTTPSSTQTNKFLSRFTPEVITNTQGSPLFVLTHDDIGVELGGDETTKIYRAMEEALRNNLSHFEVERLKEQVQDKMKEPSLQEYMSQHKLLYSEGAAIVYYTAECQSSPEKSVYRLINQQLCGRNVQSQWKPFLYLLLKGLYKLPDKQANLFRGLSVSLTCISTQYKKEGLIIWVALTSTGEEKAVLREFAKENKGGTTWIMIEALHGKEISMFSFYPLEREVLLMPNSYFEVKDVLSVSETMKELLDLPPNADYLILKEVQPKLSFDLSLVKNLTLPNPFALAFENKLAELQDWYRYSPNPNLDIMNKQRNDCSLLYTAAISGNREMVSWLLDKKCNINLGQSQGSTPLHGSSFRGKKEVVQLLMSRGADWRKRNDFNKTAYEELCEQINLIRTSSNPVAVKALPLFEETRREIEKYMH